MTARELHSSGANRDGAGKIRPRPANHLEGRTGRPVWFPKRRYAP